MKHPQRSSPHVVSLMDRMRWCFVGLAALFLCGIIGYVFIEHWTLSDSVFMTAITMSTVGYGEIQPLSEAGRFFTSALIFLSLIGVACTTACITTALVSGEISGSFISARVRKMARAFSQHTIIFGSTVMTEVLMVRLLQDDGAFVVVEEDHHKVLELRQRFPEAVVLEASPRDEMALFDAGLLKARSVVAGLESDFDNLLIAMTVKEILPNIQVVARANDPKVASRMHKIGVDKVICPFQLSGEYIADLLSGAVEGENIPNEFVH